MSESTKQAALRYASAGFAALPCVRKFPQGIVSWQDLILSRAELDSLPWDGRNVGIGTGKSSLVVVDIDTREAMEWARDNLPAPPVRAITSVKEPLTGWRGEHWYYASDPNDPIANKARIHTGVGRIGLDVRGQGGFIVAPPSVHESGAVYEWDGAPLETVPLSEMPVFRREWLGDAGAARRPPEEQGDRPDPTDAPDILYRARRYAEAMGPAIEGDGGDAHTLNLACQIVRGFNVTDEAALEILKAWNEGCRPPWDDAQLEAKIANAHRYGTQDYGDKLQLPSGGVGRWVAGLLRNRENEHLGVVDVGWLVFPHRHIDGRHAGKPHPGYIENTAAMLDAYGATVRYNLMTHETEIVVPGMKVVPEMARNTEINWFRSVAKRHGLDRDLCTEHVPLLAQPYHPVRDWVDSRPWDGADRLAQILATVKTSDPLAHTLLRRWFIQCAAALCIDKRFTPSGVLVLQGGQGVGKTRWVESLAPREQESVLTGVLFDPSDRDSLQQVTGYWITELSELDATFRRSDVAAMKAAINRPMDIYRSAYARKAEKIPRRTVFAATCNRLDFLADDTGNRRWWTVQAESCNWQHNVDMQQFWSQMVVLAQAGEGHHLDASLERSLAESNARFEIINPLISDLWETWQPVAVSDPSRTDGGHTHWHGIRDIYQALPGRTALDKPTKREANEIATALRTVEVAERKRSNGKPLRFAVCNVASKAGVGAWLGKTNPNLSEPSAWMGPKRK